MSARSIAKRAYGAIPLKRELFSVLRSIFPVPPSVHQHLHFEGPFTTHMGDGKSFRMMSYGDILENDLFWRGFGKGWEAVSVRIWQALAGISDTIFDVGANTGAYSLIAKVANPTATVVAFEPVGRIAERLRKNAAMNGFQIQLELKAVTDRSGTATLHDTTNPNNYTASLSPEGGQNTRSYEVQAVSLDDYAAGSGPPDLIKIDVERLEPQVIAGMIGTLRNRRPAIIVEVWTDDLAVQIQSQIAGLGYLIFRIDEKRGLQKVDHITPAIEGELESLNNLLCTHDQFEQAGLKNLLA